MVLCYIAKDTFETERTRFLGRSFPLMTPPSFLGTPRCRAMSLTVPSGAVAVSPSRVPTPNLCLKVNVTILEGGEFVYGFAIECVMINQGGTPKVPKALRGDPEVDPDTQGHKTP